MQPKEQLVDIVTDKFGKKWGILKEVDLDMTRWWIRPHITSGISGTFVGEAFVRTHGFDKSLPLDHILSDDDLHQIPMAFLLDIRVSQEVENRGVGTLLLQAVIEDCKLRGHTGIKGDLSDADRDHFDKLAFWYPKNGFSVKFYDEKERRKSRGKPGKVWMEFD